MAIFIDVLKEKYNIDLDKNSNKNNNENQIKKSGLFTGLRSSQTYQKNEMKHIVDHSLNKDSKNSKNLSSLIKESYLFFENSNPNQNDKSVVYRKNVKTINGTNRLAFPHNSVAKTISKNTPDKPRDGIGVRTIANTKGLYNRFIQDLKTIPKLFQNQKDNNG